MEWTRDESPWLAFGASAMAFLMGLVLAGALPFLSFFFRGFTWMVWGLVLALLVASATKLRYGRLLSPVVPYMAWFTFYFIWGLIVAPSRDYPFAIKAWTITLLLAGAVAYLTSSAKALRSFANAAQFAVVVNLVLLFLIPLSSKVASILYAVTQRSGVLNMEGGAGRYGGLWGNPNVGGYIALLVLILSVFATPLLGWMGRLCSVPIIYLTASRRAGLFLALLVVLYLFIAKRKDLRWWLGGIVAAVSLVIAFSLSQAMRHEVRSASNRGALSRMLDIEEKNTAAKGGVTRLDLFEEWSSQLDQEPWYGYGMQAMSGTRVDDDTMKVVGLGRIMLGTHNTYLGVWIDIGPVGFFAFLAVIAFYAKRTLTYPGSAPVRWALVSLCLVNLTYLFFSHSLLFSFEGQVAFALMFLLPVSPALEEWEAS
ncbi:O-antigen ligase family protein [Mesoterricola silvestris]|uniref:O-antigen ligase-related domain-containing protein n=1 Tax=Mesoterricola silvestris TaxID=2927979 RepID=A0AA48GPI1_9BACT|nr:O-antigen ligase family protein [Mesoterricola silvestris]BDU71775.1 hypothetical protein METEAL_09490 [Mesoterricola silvestris]